MVEMGTKLVGDSCDAVYRSRSQRRAARRACWIERMTHLSLTIRIGEGTVSIYVSHPFRRVFTLSKKRTSIPFIFIFFNFVIYRHVSLAGDFRLKIAAKIHWG